MPVQGTMNKDIPRHTCCGHLAPESAVSVQHLDIIAADANLSTQSTLKLSPDNFDGAVADLLVVAKAESSRCLRSSSW
jgi:hypothetical protein